MNILYVEDDARDADLTRREFARSAPRFRLDTVATQREALARLEGEPNYDLVLTDLRLPDGDGLALLAHVRERGLPLAVVVITGGGDEESAVAALKAGADDYVIKGGDYLARLPLALENALHRFRAKADRRAHPLRVLYAEHSASDVDLTRRHLARHAPYIHLDVVHSAPEVFQRLSEKDRYDLLLLDYHLPGMNGLEVLKELDQVHRLDLPVVLVTGRGDEEVAVQVLKLGAADYLVKSPGYLYRLPSVLENAFHRVQLAREQAALRESEERLSAFMDSAPDCFTLFDSELNFVDVNDATLEFFPTGTKNEDLIGKDILDVVPGLEETGRYDRYMEVIKTGKPFYVEDVVPHPKFGDRRLTVKAFKVGEGLGLIVTDITKRKRAEEALRKSEQRYRSLFEGLPVGLYRMTPQGLILHANPALVQMLGYPDRRALMAVNALDLYVNPEDYERQQVLLEREGIARDFEMQFRRYDGTVIWVRNTVQAVRSDRRDVFYHEGSLEDITERKRAEEALRESEEKYRDLVERANDGITIVQDTLLKYVNPRLAEITGYTTEEMIDTPFTKYIHPDELPKVIDRYERRMAGEDVTPVYETALRHRDRGRIDVEFNAGMITYQEKPADLVFVRDITERKRAEEERDRLLAQVQEQAQQMQQIMDTVPEGVLLLDAEGRVVLANPVAEGDLAVLAGAKVGDTLTHLGDRPLAELLARPPGGIWHEVATDDRHFEVIARPVEAGPPTGGACPEPALSAAEGPVEGACPELVEGWVLVIRDVTQEREVQRCIQQQERLAAVGQLAAGIAHDFNNIMATIVLYAQMMMRTEDRSSQDRERLVTIDQQARHAAHLTQQILDFSRRAILDRRPLDLLPFLKESLKLLERTLPENIELGLAYGWDEHVVNADPTRVQQAVMNLALNARDAMPEGGKLRIELGRIRIGPDESPPLPEMALRQAQGAEPREWVRVTVSDTGTGIPPEVLPHVFEPFFTTKPVGQGSGLGLAQVYGIVKQHEGEIGVKSQVGHGTTFTFYLPALPVSAPEPLAQETEPLAFGHGETILVVEDDPAVREALSDTLETLNYRVLNAANGREALEVYRVARSGDRPQQGVDLVLTDLVMPGMGGRELMRELRKMDPRVKGLAVTGYAVSEDLREEGIVEVVEKPFDVDTLAEAVRRALAAF